MTIQDAIKSGLPFKRKQWKSEYSANFMPYNLSIEDIVAEDWEIIEKQLGYGGIELKCGDCGSSRLFRVDL